MHMHTNIPFLDCDMQACGEKDPHMLAETQKMRARGDSVSVRASIVCVSSKKSLCIWWRGVRLAVSLSLSRATSDQTCLYIYMQDFTSLPTFWMWSHSYLDNRALVLGREEGGLAQELTMAAVLRRFACCKKDEAASSPTRAEVHQRA